MSAAEKTTSEAQEPTDHDEFAGAKLWAVYISEAENYDKALVDSWKSDMEGLLIFAGLFSASLTAFLVESYKTLTPDQGTITIAVLAQISRQLDARFNASSVDVSSLERFTPPPSSLACNILWFLSLWASLSCALIATLVQQWARDFKQITEMRPSPIIRARIFSYLYFGLRRFGMHKVVEFIPLLLHVSLLLFFAGLVAFLHPVHPALMTMTAVLLGLISAAYAYLTVLPIFSSDSPYRTALSNVIWGFVRRFSALFHSHLRSSSDEESVTAHKRSLMPNKTRPTMVEIMTRDAIQKSSERDERDARAIVWTVQSLTDDNELEPFVEALPDLIWGPTGGRIVHDYMINMLLNTRDLRLVSRIEGLLRSCDTGLLPGDREARRRITCVKALWAIAAFYASNISTRLSSPVFDQQLLPWQLCWRAGAPIAKSHLTSAHSLVRWIGFCFLSALTQEGITMLDNPSNTTSLFLLKTVHEANNQGFPEFADVLAHSLDMPVLSQRARDALISFEHVACDILTEYLRNCAGLESDPYEFDATCLLMGQRIPIPPNTQVQIKLRDTFITIITHHQDTLKAHPALHHIDSIVDMILYFLQPGEDYFDPEFARALVVYLWQRPGPSEAVSQALGRCNPKFTGSLLTKYLAHAGRLAENTSAEITLFAIMKLCSCTGLAVFNEETLTVIATTRRFLLSPCVVAVVKSHILMAATHLPSNQLAALMDRLQISSSALSETTSPLDDWDSLSFDWETGRFVIMVEFLEQSSSLSPLDAWNRHLAAQTFASLTHPRLKQAPRLLQRRFAAWFHNVINAPSLASHTHLINAIISWNDKFELESFDDRIAQTTIHAALKTYVATISDQDEAHRENLHSRINNLLVVLDSSATEIDPNLPESTNIVLDADTSSPDVSSQVSASAGIYHTPEVSLQSEGIDGY
ncbi:hypothetical protein C8R44DRAFT_742424 [Mycena epipterygia]|nr:hypothetical protein C8R44DRAFT_742424 [Mycena epipterygia]